jgi:hypothetical protein
MNVAEIGTTSPAIELILSDALAPAVVALWLSRCPTDSGGTVSTTIECSATPLGPPISILYNYSQRRASRTASLYSSQSSKTVSVDCDPRSAAVVPLGTASTVGAYFGTGTEAGQLSCRFRSSFPSSLQDIHFQLPLRVQSALWPTWDDAIIVLASGLMRSARLGSVRNGTSALLVHAVSTSVESALGNAWAVLRATRATWEGTELLAASVQTFSVTVTGASLTVLRSSQQTLSLDMHVSLGFGECNVLAVSDDSSWALLQTPPTLAACYNPQASRAASSRVPSDDCGYVSFVINTTASATMVEGGFRGAALACPPFCGGAVHAPTSVPIVDARSGTLVLGRLPAAGSGLLPQVLSDQSSVDSSAGFYIATACSAAGKC